MMKRAGLLIGGLFLAAAFAAAPAYAKPPPAGIWVQYHFKDAKGRSHVATEQVQIVRADYAGTACGAELQKDAASEARFEVTKHPELANMTFVSADCATDKSGKIKIAVGAWPMGGK